MEFIIISGLSGAGKSSAAAFLEDLGFYCVDNMPVALITNFAGLCMAGAGTGKYGRVALVTDIRGGQTFDELFQALDGLREMHLDYQLLFIEAADEDIVRRYKETRHTHPLTRQGYSLPEAVKLERLALEPVRRRASHILNSTGLNLSKFRGELLRLFGMGALEESMTVSVTSFGFKYGIPPESDLVFDVRFLPNPYYEMSLRERNGTDPEVRDYVFRGGTADVLMRYLTGMIDFLLPRYIAEGKANLIISIGCTGGKHRSVAITEALSEHLRRKEYGVVTMHRDYQR